MNELKNPGIFIGCGYGLAVNIINARDFSFAKTIYHSLGFMTKGSCSGDKNICYIGMWDAKN